MKVAVSGASGFIGRHVLNALRGNISEAVAITRNAMALHHFDDFVRVVEMDIDRPSPDCFERLGKPDVLIHLAWDGLPNYKSLQHFETELPKQYKFLKMMVTSGLPSMLVTGTCFEYGMQSGSLSPQLPTKPINPYGYAKDALRQQLEYLKLANPFNLIWGRLFYIYGEGQSKKSLFPLLNEAVFRGDRVFNMSGGEQLRDYLPVEEVAKKIVQLALTQHDIGAINICSGRPISVRRLVEQWVNERNIKIDLNLGFYQYPDYEPMAFWGERFID